MQELTTDRLVLRHWRESDLDPFAALNADPVVMEYFPAALSRDQCRALIERQRLPLELGEPGLFAAEIRESGEFIGFIGLAIPRFEAAFTPCVEVGWRLARSAWGRGLASEGAREILRHGFENLDLAEIVSFTARLNSRSEAVMERIGMVWSADFEHPSLPEGDPLRPHVLYRVSRSR